MNSLISLWPLIPDVLVLILGIIWVLYDEFGSGESDVPRGKSHKNRHPKSRKLKKRHHYI